MIATQVRDCDCSHRAIRKSLDFISLLAALAMQSMADDGVLSELFQTPRGRRINPA